jgi:hypothetical protein
MPTSPSNPAKSNARPAAIAGPSPDGPGDSGTGAAESGAEVPEVT